MHEIVMKQKLIAGLITINYNKNRRKLLYIFLHLTEPSKHDLLHKLA